MQSGMPLLRSDSTQIRAKVKILSSSLCESILIYLPMVLPILARTCWFQICKGRLCQQTHTSILDTTIVFASNFGNHDVMKRPVDPHNHGPSYNIMSLASVEGKFTMKKPLEQR